MNAKEADIIAWQMVQRAILRELDNLRESERDPERALKIDAALHRCIQHAVDKMFRAEQVKLSDDIRKREAKNCPCFRCGISTGKPKPKHGAPIYCSTCQKRIVEGLKKQGHSNTFIKNLVPEFDPELWEQSQ